jgi:predicted PP-loop superfamily ATPase
VGADVMAPGGTNSVGSNPFYRCAGPNCGVVKSANDRWWLMWTSMEQFKTTVLYLAPWREELAHVEGTLHVCGERCAQKLQSQFMGNVRENQLRRGER